MTFVNTGLTRPDRRNKPIFYVYVYWINDVPFYIGKGYGRRYKEHICSNKKTNTLLQRKIRKLTREEHKKDIKITFFIENVDEKMAFFWEGFLIRALGRRRDRNGPLCNLTWGGDRTTTGYKHSRSRRKKIRSASKVRWQDPKMRALIVSRMQHARKTGNIKREFSETAKKRIHKRSLKKFRERCKRLEAGSVTYAKKYDHWLVRFNKQYIGSASTFDEADQLRINACKAYNSRKLDTFIKQLRDKTFEEKRFNSKKYFLKVFRILEGAIKQSVNHHIRIFEQIRLEQETKNQLAKKYEMKPWLMKAPYCVFAFLINGNIMYVGCGRPDRIWRLLYKNENNEAPIKAWINSLDRLPEVRVLFVETRLEAQEWRRVWSQIYKPEKMKILGLTQTAIMNEKRYKNELKQADKIEAQHAKEYKHSIRVYNAFWRKFNNQMKKEKCMQKKISKYKGVGINNTKKRPWSATIYIKGKYKRLGAFVTEQEAALAYNEASRKYLHKSDYLLNQIG